MRRLLASSLVAASLMVVSWGLFFPAIERMPAGIAIVLFHVQPMWVLVLSALCFKEAVGRSRIVAVMAAMAALSVPLFAAAIAAWRRLNR